MNKGKIGILTWHYYDNFGSALQVYALQTYLMKQGYDVEIINYRKLQKTDRKLKRDIKYVLGKVILPLNIKANKSYRFEVFRRDYLFETKILTDKNEMDQYSSKYQCVICGSDQIWAPNVFNPIYMFDFLKAKTVKRISYSASIGLNDIPLKLVSNYSELLKKFDAVSVREESGKRLLLEKCGIRSTVVIDPTLLIDVDEYNKIKIDPPAQDSKFVFCYFLNKKNNYRTRVEKFANNMQLNIVGVSSNPNDAVWMRTINQIGPREFLGMISKADFVFTDSYHGTIFSMIFHRPFFVFERFIKGDPVNQNERIYQLDRWFDIKERILSENRTPQNCDDLDYLLIEQKLLLLRKHSEEYLLGALV